MPAPEQSVTGACLCGAVRYRLEGPVEVVECHCRECRRATGAAFATWVCSRTDRLTWMDGAPAGYLSSSGCRRCFCAVCGSTLAMEYLLTQEIAVAIGTLDAPQGLRASASIWLDERIAAAGGAMPGAAAFPRQMESPAPAGSRAAR